MCTVCSVGLQSSFYYQFCFELPQYSNKIKSYQFQLVLKYTLMAFKENQYTFKQIKKYLKFIAVYR